MQFPSFIGCFYPPFTTWEFLPKRTDLNIDKALQACVALALRLQTTHWTTESDMQSVVPIYALILAPKGVQQFIEALCIKNCGIPWKCSRSTMNWNLFLQVSIWYGCVLRGDLNTIHISFCSNIQDKTVIHAARYVKLCLFHFSQREDNLRALSYGMCFG